VQKKYVFNINIRISCVQSHHKVPHLPIRREETASDRGAFGAHVVGVRIEFPAMWSLVEYATHRSDQSND
jgi:hypothetical protein